MGIASRDATPFHTWVTEEQRPNRRQWVDGRLLAGDIVDDTVIRISGRRLHVPAQTEVEGQAWANAEIILREERRVPAIGVARHGGVLRDRAGYTDQEIGKGVTRRGCHRWGS